MKNYIVFALIIGTAVFTLALYIGLNIGESFEFKIKENAIKQKTNITRTVNTLT